MPSENERKYVLKDDGLITEILKQPYISSRSISQHYVEKGPGWSFRVRKSATLEDFIYTSCYKRKINNRVLEIETDIDERDYKDLRSIAICNLTKTRYDITHDNLVWEIDYFWDTAPHNVYFIMAEVELDEGVVEPPSIPPFIQDRLLHQVGLNEKGFSSKKLCDVDYGKDLYKKLLGMEHGKKT